LWPLVIVLVLGCNTSDERLRELSEQSVARQADQNRQIAQQSAAVVEASRELVTADGQARREQLELQQKLVEAEDRSRQELTQIQRTVTEADAQARQTMMSAHAGLQHELQTERASIDRQRLDLEQDRRQLATARQRDPIVAAAISTLGVLLACLTPLMVCIYLLRAIGTTNDSGDELSDLLVLELTGDRPAILSRREPQLPAPADKPPALDGPAKNGAA
jgi:hypothetical protein